MGNNVESLPGFNHVGNLRGKGGKARWSPSEAEFPQKSAVYAFVVKRQVRYIGAAESLKRRMTSYLNHQVKNRMTRRVHEEICKVLSKGSGVGLFAVLIDHQPYAHNGLPVDLLVGIEAGLLLKLSPKWNRRGIGELEI